MQVDETGPDDGILVALIDGRLGSEDRAALERRLAQEPGLRARLAHLQRGGLGLAEGFAALGTAAPHDRLNALLAAAQAAAAAAKSQDPVQRRGGWRPAAIAAGFALFLAGAASGHWLPALWPSDGTTSVEETGADGWRAAVAEYFPLTTTQTLQAMPRDMTRLRADLGAAGLQADVDLSPERLVLPGLTLARVDLFQLDDKALVEISYLDPQNGPIALCILARGDVATGPHSERRGAMNIAWWANGTHALMLIGQAPAPQLQALADRLTKQLGA